MQALAPKPHDLLVEMHGKKTWTESHAAMLVSSTLVDGC